MVYAKCIGVGENGISLLATQPMMVLVRLCCIANLLTGTRYRRHQIMNNDLHPLMKSERRILQDKIREAEQRFSLAYSQACSKFTSIINTDESLTLEQKTNILERLWK